MADKFCHRCVFHIGCAGSDGVGECKGFVEADDDEEEWTPVEEVGMKFDAEKTDWFALPLEILEPLAELMLAGEKKYGTFNCLERFDNPDRRFWSANMRHAKACQQDPLAIDPETGCYHEAARAFSSLMRLYHCRKEQEL